MYLGSNVVNWRAVVSGEADDSLLNEIIMRTISYYENSSIALIKQYAFCPCSSLTSINIPNVISIGSHAFSGCINLTSIDMSKVQDIYSYAFDGCTSLTSINMPNITSIDSYAFRSCYNLLSVYLLGSSIPTLELYVFQSTPISNYTTSTGGVYGSIFVPASLYGSYLTATNWSVYSDRIMSVSI